MITYSYKHKHIIKIISRSLKRCRYKNEGKGYVIIRHNLVNLYNPVNNTYKVPYDNQVLSWLICVYIDSTTPYKQINLFADINTIQKIAINIK